MGRRAMGREPERRAGAREFPAIERSGLQERRSVRGRRSGDVKKSSSGRIFPVDRSGSGVYIPVHRRGGASNGAKSRVGGQPEGKSWATRCGRVKRRLRGLAAGSNTGTASLQGFGPACGVGEE